MEGEDGEGVVWSWWEGMCHDVIDRFQDMLWVSLDFWIGGGMRLLSNLKEGFLTRET